MRVNVFEINHGDCPYLPDRAWVTDTFQVPRIDGRLYENLLSHGWRRSGNTFYRNVCPGCTACLPIRIPTHRFVASKSQRRVIRRNTDVACTRRRTEFTDEAYDLYRAYCDARHGPHDIIGPKQFATFLVESPVRAEMMEYRVAGRLVGVGWIDLLADGISSVYFVFDPAESGRSLGTFSALTEISLARDLGLQWVYLGFFVDGSRKMEYKARFRPHQLLVSDRWIERTE
ncbi:MAG: arginyltransferase [Spirochaetaceae bacterium]|nr:MAG: arginyltransferase [Spirochaetaceae bacterium]